MKSIKTDFGAIGDGIADDSPAFNAAVLAGGHIYLDPGIYRVTQTITLPYIPPSRPLTIEGAGTGNSIIITESSGPGILFNVTNNNTKLCDFTLKRESVVNSSQSGIDTGPYVNHVIMTNLELNGHYYGLKLGATSYSYIEHTIVLCSHSNGIHITNTPQYFELQWSLFHILLGNNDGWGLLVSPANIAQVSLGEWSNISTFANTIGGVAVQGTPTCAVQGVRMRDCFIGQDGLYGVYFDSYNVFPHHLSNVTVEAVGTTPTGKTNQTPASNRGIGIAISLNNGYTKIDNSLVVNSTWSGIMSGASKTCITNTHVQANGLINYPGYREGITIMAGQAQILNNTIYDNKGWGISISGTGHIFASNRHWGNILGNQGPTPLPGPGNQIALNL